jgi:AraC-like DNA-binding protein
MITNTLQHPKVKKRLGIASIGAVNQYLAQAQFEGIECDAILSKSGIDETELADNASHITGIQFQQLISLLLEHSNNPFFGLHSSAFVRPDSYSLLGFISINCRTFGEAIAKIQPFEPLVGDMGATRLSSSGQSTQIQWICQYTNPQVVPQMVDNCLASWLTFTRSMIGPNYSPQRVLLRRQAPSLTDQQQYQRFFACSVRFNQNIDALVFDKALLGVPLTQADPNLLAALESQATSLVQSLSLLETTAEKVEMLVNTQLSRGLPKLSMIAQQLEIGEKTLQRRLKIENTSYIAVLNAIRLNQVEELLLLNGLSLVEISQMVGFSEPRSFYRWFKQITGHSPRHCSQSPKQY